MNNDIVIGHSEVGLVAVATNTVFKVLSQDSEMPGWGVRKDPEKIKAKDGSEFEIIYWGQDNKLPLKLVDTISKDSILSPNMAFNITSMYGDGVKPYLREVDEKTGKIKLKPCLDENVLEFFERHLNFVQYLLEQSTDLSYFYNTCLQLIINEDLEVVRIKSLEMGYCRMTKKVGEYSPYIAYDDLFGTEDYNPENTIFIDAINPYDPINDIQEKLGIIPNEDGLTEDQGKRVFALKIVFPTPLKQYYSKPYYTSVFDSGWAEFNRLIPQFKKAILKNQSTIKYNVTFHPTYFDEIFKSEVITDSKEKRKRIMAEFKKIDDYLGSVGNAGKALQSVGLVVKDSLISKIKIEVLDNHFKGGEYLDDSEEVANFLCFAQGVHPSIIGATPGKGKSISGTEARELLLIKNAQNKPYRDLILTPFYIAKALNKKWPRNLVFEIPFTVLTTLDSGSGAKKNIGMENEGGNG